MMETVKMTNRELADRLRTDIAGAVTAYTSHELKSILLILDEAANRLCIDTEYENGRRSIRNECPCDDKFRGWRVSFGTTHLKKILKKARGEE